MVMKNGDVYSIIFSSKYLPLLGISGHRAAIPLVPVKLDELCGQDIQDVRSGSKHVIVLTSDGRLHQWGRVHDGKEVKFPKLKRGFVSENLENTEVAQIACGVAHTLALTQKGDVFSWGSNVLGQLGTGTRTFQTNPIKISGLNGFENKIVSIACGGMACYALDNEGNVWSWGCREVGGALGYPSLVCQLSPRKIPSLNDIQKIVVGSAHVLALSKTSELYFWGQHATETQIVIPMRMEVPNIVDIGAIGGCSVSGFQTSEGEVYFWGFAYGLVIPDPVATKFSSLSELFASLDAPMLLKPLEFDVHEATLEKLRLSFDDQETGDIKFSVDGKLIYAHKTVLKLCNQYFRRMFENGWKESSECADVLQISDFTYEGFRTFLLYLYTGRIQPPPLTALEAIELFRLGDYYGEDDLKGRCEQLLVVLTTESSVCEVYSVAVQYNSKVLHDLAMNFIVPHLNAVIRT